MKMYKLILLLFLTALSLTSCRKEEMEIITPPEEEQLDPNSANLLFRTTTRDGSSDNILDNARCFSVILPVTVTANGIEVVVETEDDFQTIEDIFDEFSSDNDILIIDYPISIIRQDYSIIEINSQTELNVQASLCTDPSLSDDDIECADLVYPFTASLFNEQNENIDTLVFNSDQELYEFVANYNENLIVTFEFPISIVSFDGTISTVDNFDELSTILTAAIDACDEDDDNDFNDDDCVNCTTQQLNALLTSCADWRVDKLERDNEELEDIYVGYLFNFDINGTLIVNNGQSTFNGTWASSGEGNNIIVAITVAGLPDFNDDWNLHEIEELANESKVDLRLNDDRLRFKSDCTTGGGGGGIDDTALIMALTMGNWYITYFFDEVDETAVFMDYEFAFASDNTATATNNSGTTTGTWLTAAGDETELELNLNFGTSIPLIELAEDWDVLEFSNEIIRLKDVSGGSGAIEYLTFERDPFTGGGGGGSTDLNVVLPDGIWFVETYLDDGVNQTGDYTGYNIDFDSSGSVQASNGSNVNNGIWQVQSGGNILLLNFGTSFPFNEFNDDWDVLFVSETRVELQDVSGGGGGTDTLIMEKF